MIFWTLHLRLRPFSCPSVCIAWAAPLPAATVEEACMVHGIDVDKLLALVNEEANKAQ